MPNTIIETILSPKYQKECNFRNLKDKVEICEELKRLETEITTQLDGDIKNYLGNTQSAGINSIRS